MKTVVAFLDALQDNEASGWLKETLQGKVDSGVPRVTPPIIGSFLTGKDPGQHGLVSPTPLYKSQLQKPEGETIIERVAERQRVLSYMIPFTMGVDHPNAVVNQAGMAGEAVVQDPNMAIPQARANPVTTSPEKMLQGYIDHARIIFSTIRQMIRNNAADTYFISFRNIDSLTHWHYNTDCRQRLIDYVSYEMKEFMLMGDNIQILWFSDHGGYPKKDRFCINRWLVEKGYLDVTYLSERHKKQMELFKEQQNQEPHWEQVGVASPFIQIEPDSKFVSSDAFDSCVEIIGDSTDKEIKDFVKDLESTGHYDRVYRKNELWPENTNKNIPEIIPDRKLGHLVSGNVHPRATRTDADEVVNYRTGDHSRHGCYGGTVELNGNTIKPLKLFNIVDILTKKKKEKEREKFTAQDEQIVRDRLQKLGYL